MRSRNARTLVSTLLGTLALMLGSAASAQMGMGMGSVDSAELLSNVPGSNSLQQDSGFFLGSTCDDLGESGVSLEGSSATNDLFRQCSTVVASGLDLASGSNEFDTGFDLDDLLNSLFVTAHEEATAQARLALGAAGASLGSINERMIALRQGARGIQVAGFRIMDDAGNQLVGEDIQAGLREHAANGGGSLFDERLGVFFNGLGAWGDYDGGDREIDFDTRSWGMLAGADYRIGESLVAGLAMAFSRTDDDFSRDAGTLKSDAWSGSLFATYGQDAWFVDGIFSLTGVDYELRRKLRYPGLSRTADGDTDGFVIAAAAGAGYDFTFGALTVGPRVRAEYVDTEVDSFEERKAGGLNLSFDSQNIQSFTTDLGVDANYAVSTGFGIVTPYTRASWQHEYLDNSRDITARFSADPNRNRFRLRTQSPDRNVLNFGAGVALTLPNGFSAFIDFDTVLASKLWDLYALTVGGRIAF